MAAASQLVAVLAYGMWSPNRVAATFGRGDIAFHAALIRSLQLTGSYSAGPHLGAPNGQALLDFPLGGDHLHLLAMRLLAELPISAISVLNLYFLLSFAVVSGVTHLTLRSLGSDAAPAAAAAVLFAFVPYHLAHGISHSFLSMYPAVPLALLLSVWVAERRWRGQMTRWRWAFAAASVVVIGCTSAYYAVFGAILIVTAAAVGSVRSRDPRPLVVGLATAAAIAVVLVANVSPTLVHRAAEGENIDVAQRTTLDAEVYGLRPATMVVPDPGHRIPAFARGGLEVVDVPNAGELGSYLGLVGVLGLVALFGVCLAVFGHVSVNPVLSLLAPLLLVIFLVGTRGGGGFLLALAGFTDIRAWGRTSLVIALLSLAALALLATAFAGHVGKPAVAVASAVLVILGLFDQIPREPVPARSRGVAEAAAERRLVLDMEDALPRGAMVYQLPYQRFPEGGPRADMVDFDQLRPYVLGRGRLRWSAGGMRGRRADWQELWGSQPAPVLLRAVAVAGFSALLINRTAYQDNADALLVEVTALTASTPHLSADGLLAWYDLRPLAARIGSELGPEAELVGKAVTSIPRAVWASGFDPISGPPPGPRVVDDGASLKLRPARGGNQSASLLLSVDVPPGVAVAVTTDHGSWRSAGAGPQHGRLPIPLDSKGADVRFAVAGADEVTFAMIAPVDAAVLSLLPETSGIP
ncbi:MAG: hypothetical protein WKF86_02295 [Acidimicrobiales bacterium]